MIYCFLARSDSGIINPTFQSIPLDSLLLEVVEEQVIIAKEKSINLSLEIIDNISEPNLKELEDIEDLFTIEGDWGQLSRLFTNLISNAIIHGFETNNNQKSTIQVILKVCKKKIVNSIIRLK